MSSKVEEVRDEVWKLCLALVSPDPSSSVPKPGVDGYVAAVFCVALFLLNWGVRIVIVAPVGRYLLTTGKTRKKRVFEGKLIRFAQSTMEAIFYGGFTILGATIVPNQPWVWPSSQWWENFSTGDHLVMRDDLRCYYLLYGARYFQGFISVLLEPKRKDYVEMQIHHVVTVAVVWVSYLYGWNRVGAVVMLLLDPADVPLHVAKLQKHIADAHVKTSPGVAKLFYNLADSTFVLFAVTFFVTRVAMYPYICWSAHVEATRYFPKGIPEWSCVALLEILLVLQCYWFFLIVKAAVNMLIRGHVEDVRSDDDDDDDTTTTTTKKSD